MQVNPMLGSLADNGGPTMTHALLPGSPAIDAADPAMCPSADQRGAPRVDGDGDSVAACDIGAFEYLPEPDMDGDGCSNERELGLLAAQGGQRDLLSFWDFFDVPTPPAFARDRSVSVADIAAVVARFGAAGDETGDPLSPPPLPPAYHTAYDRTLAGPDPWDSGPPNGSITIEDIMRAVGQFGHTCA
jgi:hypothetical protein